MAEKGRNYRNWTPSEDAKLVDALVNMVNMGGFKANNVMAEKGRNYRNWTPSEDAKLVDALVNMVNMGGFKANNGFKSGYLQHLENALKETIPNSGIMGKPHIESRIKTMKNDWQVVYDMVNGTNTSGFDYDSDRHCVYAEAAVWESYIEIHKKAGKWRNKTFPHFQELCNVFGKDRAQGNRAKDFVQMENDANLEEENQQMEDEFERPVEVSPNTPTNTNSSVRLKKRKSRVDPIVEGITTAATLLEKGLQQAATTLNQAMHGETDIEKKSVYGGYRNFQNGIDDCGG
ncbi:hypothetical protein L2E82_08467 [Cichorium intybus]|uniref:Uncharacterized protein n=1 Tax=Cichorium intybus TaxID=13427 RepID=A0ACB9G743_CICIN|nr:hypothetical protein L2E82_08467 [Cichorium intybus]